MPKKTVDFGDLRRFSPICERWGNSRGGAIDRYYVDRYLKDSLANAAGRFLECGGMIYRSYVRSENIVSYDVLDIDPECSDITIQADLQDIRQRSAASFDVIICTQVLQYVPNPLLAIQEMYRVLAPSGLLILSVPFVEKDYTVMNDRWRIGKLALSEMLSSFGYSKVEGRGNLLSSISYLAGFGIHDMTERELDHIDSSFYQVVVAKAYK